MNQSTQLTFPTGHSTKAIFPDDLKMLSTDLQQLDFEHPCPTIVVIGGAKGMTEESRDRVRRIFQEVLAPLAREIGAIIVDGGTDDGVMQMMGIARMTTGNAFNLVGVAPLKKVQLPPLEGSPGTPLEPHHTHFILTPGSKWGDESRWLAHIASVLAKGCPSVTLLINGGEVALIDLAESTAEGRPAIILAGSGRLADEVAESISHPQKGTRSTIAELLSKGKFTVFDLATPLTHLTQLLKQQLSPDANL